MPRSSAQVTKCCGACAGLLGLGLAGLSGPAGHASHGSVRACARDGIPFRLVTRTPVPDKVRLLVLADVSLSVPPDHRIHAQTCPGDALACAPLHCDGLRRLSIGRDNHLALSTRATIALATVLADARLDLEASSDYGEPLRTCWTRTERVEQAHCRDHRGGRSVQRTAAEIVVGEDSVQGAPHRPGCTPSSRRYWAQAACSMEEYERHSAIEWWWHETGNSWRRRPPICRACAVASPTRPPRTCCPIGW